MLHYLMEKAEEEANMTMKRKAFEEWEPGKDHQAYIEELSGQVGEFLRARRDTAFMPGEICKGLDIPMPFGATLPVRRALRKLIKDGLVEKKEDYFIWKE